ncbi:hypothetical protein Rfer_4442 (plasmid) [Rhodoferax ferrireducens T118]|uniref:Uncharacterized protein n=1 Tax=Albidiferax ferrireducens (strain ATCC BAA-621 / DSM 15236 / T118) TaxID=338969 RepID=Q21Q17_ALBFT|nr:hypothetical protein [Rhodoferax ferrireducens]ABD72128.1 hypothetical protein Rfer_4442 [Rhodoferax ferrireducens T118]
MADITIPSRLWHRLADVIQDMGNHHSHFAGTSIGADLDVLGNAIKHGVPPYPGAELCTPQYRLLEQADKVILKHSGTQPNLSTVEQSIETAGRLMGLWATESTSAT